MCGYGLSDSTVGIIGLGRIGKCSSESRFLFSSGGRVSLEPHLQPGLLEGVPAGGGRIGMRWSLQSFSTQTVLGLCDSGKVMAWCSPV